MSGSSRKPPVAWIELEWLVLTQTSRQRIGLLHGVSPKISIHMDKALDDLITRYVDVAADLFPKVAEHLGVSIPISNMEWTCLDVPQRGSTPDGIDYFKHGYGVAMSNGEYKIDLDLGGKGEINGFDGWRLFDFAECSRIQTSFGSHKEIEFAIQQAVNSGELTYSGYILYYRA